MPPAVFVHLSDIHFDDGTSAWSARMNSVRTHLVADLAAMRDRLGMDATAIVVTGDIAYSGDEKEYQLARAWLDEVATAVGSPDALVLTVPGNHDVHWPSILPAARIARESLRSCPPERLTEAIDELIADASRPLLAPLDNYNRFALGYRCEVPSNGQPWEAPLALSHGYHLALRGLTTVFNSDRNDSPGSLVVGRTQTSLPLSDPGAVHVLLAHHGPEDCRDRTEIRDRLRHRAWTLLCGHRHDQRIQQVEGCVELIAGAVHPEEQAGYDPTYNWIRYDVAEDSSGGHRLVTDIWQRVMRPEWNRFGDGGEGSGPRRYEQPLPALPAARPSRSAPAAGAVPPGPTADAAPAPSPGAGAQQQAAALQVPAAAGAAADGAQPRPPLIDDEGRVDAQRRVVRDLLDLPVPDQENVLRHCSLLTDDDDKDHVAMILTALERLDGPGAAAALAAAVTAAAQGGNQ